MTWEALSFCQAESLRNELIQLKHWKDEQEELQEHLQKSWRELQKSRESVGSERKEAEALKVQAASLLEEVA